MKHHQYGISARGSQTSFGGETNGSIAKWQLFSQATFSLAPVQLCRLNKRFGKNKEQGDLLGEEKFFIDSQENGSNSKCKNKYTKEDMHWQVRGTGTIRQCRKQKTHKTKNKLYKE